jgi:hypothetical protein
MKSDFIELFTHWSREAEAPTSYWEASALSTLAAVAERKLWYEQGENFERVYPNLYLALVGPPASHKGSGPKKAQRLLRSVQGVYLAPDEVTPQRFYSELEGNVKDFTLTGDTEPTYHCSGTVISTEWAVFLLFFGLENMRLEKLYDCEDTFQYHTVHNQCNDIYNVYLNMIGCIQPKKLGEVVPPSSIGSGFFSRVIMVVEHGPRHSKSKPRFSMMEQNQLITTLQKIHLAKGAMSPSKEADEWYDHWYDYESGKSVLADQAKFAYYLQRKKQHLVKVAMLMCLSRTHGESLTIELEDYKRALTWLNKIEPNMPDAFAGFGSNPMASTTFDVVKHIQRLKAIDFKDLMGMFWEDATEPTMERILSDLEAQGLITKNSRDEKNNRIVRWIGDGISKKAQGS